MLCNNERIIDIISVKLEVGRCVSFVRIACDSPRITWKSGLQTLGKSHHLLSWSVASDTWLDNWPLGAWPARKITRTIARVDGKLCSFCGDAIQQCSTWCLLWYHLGFQLFNYPEHDPSLRSKVTISLHWIRPWESWSAFGSNLEDEEMRQRIWFHRVRARDLAAWGVFGSWTVDPALWFRGWLPSTFMMRCLSWKP